MVSTMPMWFLVATFLAAIVGALFPFVRMWSERQLHLFVALAAGIFLGVAFLHILPRVAGNDYSGSANFMVLVGFLAILLIERVLLSQHERVCGHGCGHEHAVIGYATMIGLTIHSIADGLSLGVAMSDPSLGLPIFIAIVSHKAVDGFSLGTVFRLAQFKTRRSLFLLVLFSAVTPLAALLPLTISTKLSPFQIHLPVALAAGTFLYVATCDLVPEAFHENRGRIGSFIALLAGLTIMFAMTLVE
ncbi:MAG: ZIP family metal transporter [Deltaproteobacteria bacterium]|nr:ZIP family metal transporter [Deltaproteobacteria bacterium]